MPRRLYLILRDLHLYCGLFISPFVVLFALSVFVLVHPRGVTAPPSSSRLVRNLALPSNLESLSGRARVHAVRPVLEQAGIGGEIGFIRYIPKEHRLEIPVTVPGRETTLDLNLSARTATITERKTGLLDALVQLHKAPGPHLADIRMNWIPMAVWRWFADATVYLLVFLTASGIYLWAVLRAERRVGFVLLTAGALTFFGMAYGLAG
jgi:hypothetical protein